MRDLLKMGPKTYTKPGVFQSMYELDTDPFIRGKDFVVKKCVELKGGKRELCVKMMDVTCEGGDCGKCAQIEVNIMNMCKKHDNILKIMSVFETPSHLFILHELCPKNNLHDYLSNNGTLNKQQICTVMPQLLSAVKYIHHKDIVHRNIKLETVLVTEKLTLKLSDFSHASIVNNNTEVKEATGSLNYMAPELIKLILGRSEVGYGKPVDVWAVGIILAYLITGNFLFWDESISRMMQTISIVFINYKLPVWKNIHPQVKHLLEGLLRGEAEKRLTAGEGLLHPLFKEKIVIKKENSKITFKVAGMAVLAVVVMRSLMRKHHKLKKVVKAVKLKNNRAYSVEYIRRLNDKSALDLFSHWTGDFNKQKRVMLFQSSQKFITSRVKKVKSSMQH